jgi:carboxylesterase type B
VVSKGHSRFNGSTIFQPQNATQKAFAAEEIAYLLSFVRTGDPNAEKMKQSPLWPSWDEKTTKSRIVLRQDVDSVTGSKSVSEVVSDEEIERCLQSASLVDDEQN